MAGRMQGCARRGRRATARAGRKTVFAREVVGGSGDGGEGEKRADTCCVDHVIHNDAVLAFNLPDDIHSLLEEEESKRQRG